MFNEVESNNIEQKLNMFECTLGKASGYKIEN